MVKVTTRPSSKLITINTPHATHGDASVTIKRASKRLIGIESRHAWSPCIARLPLKRAPPPHHIFSPRAMKPLEGQSRTGPRSVSGSAKRFTLFAASISRIKLGLREVSSAWTSDIRPIGADRHPICRPFYPILRPPTPSIMSPGRNETGIRAVDDGTDRSHSRIPRVSTAASDFARLLAHPRKHA